MGFDTSFYTQQTTPDIIGNMEKGQRMGDMMLARSKQNAVDQAYRDGIKQNDDGTTSLDQNATLAGLAKADPRAYMQAKSQFAEQNKSDMDMQNAKRMQTVNAIAQIAPTISDQATYESGINHLAKMGLVDPSQVPKEYDPDLVNRYHAMALSAKDQIGEQQKDRELDLKDKEIGAKYAEVGSHYADKRTDKSNQMMNQTQALLESARGNPAVAQAEKDLYSADKAKSLVNLYGDPNKLTTPQVNLLVSEIGKIASGGVPSMHELDGLTPGTLTGAMARGWERLSNDPTPANAGAFVKQYQDYANALSNDAKKVIKDKYGRIIESRRGALGDDNYKTLQDQYLNRFNDGPKEGETKEYQNKTYKVQNGHWVEQ